MSDFNTMIDQAIANVEAEMAKAKEQLDVLEKDFSDVKLNPYGITNIDFSKRQDLMSDYLKMEGAIMGLNLAKEQFANLQA
jgi:uncharacterized protein (DUF2164 family)